MNNQLSLQKAIYNRNNSTIMLAKYGGNIYRSTQSKKSIHNNNDANATNLNAINNVNVSENNL